MPIFEYECQDCGEIFELFMQRREPSASPKCPACGKANVDRLWSAFAQRIDGDRGCASGSTGFG